MTNAEIERLLTMVTKTVNTLSTVVYDIDELLGMGMCLLLIGRRLCVSICGEMITLISDYLLLSLLMG